MDHWQGPRPRLLSATVEGPFYESWPPKRQVALLGKNPLAKNAAAILRPIAERAWRRPVRDGELKSIVSLLQAKAAKLGDVEALKEGLVAVLVSPAFLLLNTDDLMPADRFAAKFSYFLHSTLPDTDLRAAVAAGRLDTLAGIRAELGRRLANGGSTSDQQNERRGAHRGSSIDRCDRDSLTAVQKSALEPAYPSRGRDKLASSKTLASTPKKQPEPFFAPKSHKPC